MPLTRRQFLRLGALTATATVTAACRQAAPAPAPPPAATATRPALQPPAATPSPQPTAPSALPAPDDARLLRLVNRAGYGPRLGEMQRIRDLGFDAYLEEQLHPETLADPTDAVIAELFSYEPDFADLKNEEARQASTALIGGMLVRQLASPRQLYEAMVEFWSDHFHIYLGKNAQMPFLKLLDDRQVIRPNALTTFRDLLFASAHSPAMLVYLDNVANVARSPNENYARELLELHTVSLSAGYSQTDVDETARILTGWTMGRPWLPRSTPGAHHFAPGLHDDGAKTVLGHTFPAGQGEQDVVRLLDMLAAHPATAQHIATKLVRRFVADEPPPELVARVHNAFLATGGDIKTLLRLIFTSDAFAAAPPKLKRPHTFAVSLLRVLGVALEGQADLGGRLWELGQPPFQWPAPNGYPDVSAAWVSNLLPRWNLTLELVHGRIDNLRVPWDVLQGAAASAEPRAILATAGLLITQQPLADATLDLLTDYVSADGPVDPERLRDALALLLISPAFQLT